MTVRDLITKAYQELNVFDASTAIGGDDATFGLDMFNDWVDALATEGLTVAEVTRTTWALTGAASYTIGIGGAVNVTRPVSPQAIEAIGYVDPTVSPDAWETLVTLLSVQEYASWSHKGQTWGGAPWAWYYNPTFGPSGFGTLIPVPTAPSGLDGVIYVPTPVAEFASVNATLSVPPGYRRFYRTNLAVEISGAMGVPMPDGLQQRAVDAKANVKRANIRIEEMGIDAPWAGFGGMGGGIVDMGGWQWTGDAWVQL